jgi:DNA repair/transcription protein MET18/MMS19
VNILAGISNGQITLLNVVKALGEYLMAEEDQLRAKGNALVPYCCTLFPHVKVAGVEFLSLVLGQCSPEKINRQSGAKYFRCL